MKTTRIYPEEFPTLIKQMNVRPKFLDIAGAPIPGDDYKFLCVIGARRHSDYGRDVCKHLINGLRGYPIVIVSGLALGIDSIAHEAALDAGLRTVAFPGSGLARHAIAPATHLHLAERIIRSGNTLLSPFEREQAGAPWTFPVRNQLMAGISHATLIIEGKENSGTLLTAKYALDMSRDVLIVPGSIFSDLSYGPHKLYIDGAIPITTAKEILIQLDFEVGEDIKPNKKAPDTDQLQLALPQISLSPEEKSIIQALQYAKLSATDLIEKTSLNPTIFNITVTQLELNGMIIQSDGIYRIHHL